MDHGRGARAVHHDAPRALGLGGGEQRSGGAVGADQQIDLVLDQLGIELARAHRARIVVEHPQLEPPLEQPARLVDLLAPELDALQVVGGELRVRAGLRNHHADNDRTLLRQGEADPG